MPTVSTVLAGVRGALRGPLAALRQHDDLVVRTQVRIAELPAPTGMEAERGRLVNRWFRRAGLHQVHTDEAGNVLALRPAFRSANASPGTSALAPVVVLAHLDTVFPAGTPCIVRRDAGRLTGPGIGDNGRGLAAMLAIAAALADPALPLGRPLLFVATTGEEGHGDLRGARHLFSTLPRPPAAAIVLDGPGDSAIVHQAVGSRRFRVHFSGPGGHSWTSAGAANPIHAAARATTTIANSAAYRGAHPSLTLAVTRTGGGLSVNAIPESAWLDVDVRALTTTALDAGERVVREAVAAAVAAENGSRAAWSEPCTARVVGTGSRPAGVVSSSDPLVRLAAAATRMVHRAPVLTAASTDANVPISLGIPAVAIGAGGTGGGTHTVDEWFENTHGALGIERAVMVVAGMAQR